MQFTAKRRRYFVIPLVLVLVISGVTGLLLTKKTYGASITWDGGGGDNNWSTAANWSTDTVPTPADIVIFDGTSVKDATIDADFYDSDGGTTDEIQGISITADYTGTITVATDLLIDTNDFTQAGGTFDCGSQTITSNGAFTKSGGTLDEGTGKWVFANWYKDINVDTSETFYDVEVNSNAGWVNIIAGDTIVVSNDLTLTKSTIENGTIEVHGNITQAATFTGGDATIEFAADGTAQTYTMAGGTGPIVEFDAAADANDSIILNADAAIRGLTITTDFGANAVPFTYNGYNLTISTGTFSQAAGTFTAPSVLTLSNVTYTKTGGTFVEGTNEVVAAGNGLTLDVDTSEDFYDLTVNTGDYWYGLTVSNGDTINVANDLTLTEGFFNGNNSGAVSVSGNITQAATFDGGTGVLHFGNDSVAQTYSIAGGTTPIIYLDAAADANDSIELAADTIIKGLFITSGFGANAVPMVYNSHNITFTAYGFNQAAGTFTAPAVMTMQGANFTKTGGTFVEGTGEIQVTVAGSTFDVATSEEFYNLTINSNDYWNGLTVATGDTVIVTNHLALTEGIAAGASGFLEAQGSVTQAATFDGGDVTLDMGDDTEAQTYTINGGGTPRLRFDAPADADDNFVINAAVNFRGINITSGFGDNTVPLDLSSYDVTIYGYGFIQEAGTFTAPSVMTLQSANFTKTGGTFVEGTGEIIFTTGGGIIDVDTTETFYDITVNTNDYWNGLTIASNDIVVVSNTFTITEGFTNAFGTGTLEAQGDVLASTNADGGSMSFKFSGSNTQTFDLTGVEDKFNGDITVNKSGGQVNLASNLTMDATNQDFIIEEGTFDLAGNDLSVTGAGTETLIVEDGGNLQLQGDETITGDSASYPQLDSGSTVTYDGSGSYTLKDYTYSGLATAGSGTYTMGTAEAIDDLTITSGTFDVSASNYVLTVSDDFSNSGTFNARAGTVTFDDAAQTSVIAGSTSFYNLECTTANKAINFTAGTTQTVTGDLTLTGTSGNDIVLRSTSDGSAWNLNVSGTQDVTYVDVKDSDASGGDQILAGDTSTDSTGNTNWSFTDNTVPTAASVTASQVTDGSGTVTVQFVMDDTDDDDTLEALVEYDIGGGWQKATLSESDGDTTSTYGDPKVENDDTYQVGNASGYITSSSGANTITVIWNASVDESTADVADAQIRVTPYDGTGAGSAASSSTFALDVVAPTYSSSRYYDTNTDGTVDRVDVVFDENVTLSSYNTADWTFPAVGSVNLDDTNASSSTATVTLTVTADANETGGTTAPTVLYTNNAGRLRDDAGNPVATFGGAQTITDDADPFIVSLSPVHGASGVSPSADVVVTFTEPINTATDAYTFSNGPTGQSTAWTTGDTVLTISHTGDFDAGSQTFTMTTANDTTGNSLAGAISGVTHPTTFTVNTVPTAASVTASQVTDGSGTVTVQFVMDDTDDDDTLQALVEYDIGGGWTKATLSEADGNTTATYGDPKVENDDTYQVGNALGYITSSSGANTITVIWNASVDESTADVADAQVRITPYDGTGAGSTASSSTFALDVVAPTYSSSRYYDTNTDGTVDRVDVVFDENVTLTSYSTSDWSFTEQGSITLDDSDATASSATVTLTVTADANETGGSTAPTIQYTNNAGRLTDASGNPVATFGVAQTVTDDADPFIISISPAHGDTATPDQDVVVVFTEPINTGTDAYSFSSAPTGISDAWTVGNTTLTVSHTGDFADGAQTFTMTTANDTTGNSLAGAISGVTHPATFTVVSNTNPVANSVTGSQVVGGGGTVTVQFTLDDTDDDDTLQALVEYDVGSGWTKATLSETDGDTSATYGDPKVENDDTYQVGNASGYVTTSSGANTVTTIWNASADETGIDISSAKIRITPYDGSDAGTPAESSNFDLDLVAPTYSSSRFYDDNTDGTVDRVDVVFDENITLSSYDTSDWTFPESGSITLDDTAASGSTATVTLTVTADAQETGGATAPTILYTNNAGRLTDTYGNAVATFGGAQTITDDADPFIISVSPAHGATANNTDDVVVTFTEPINTATDAYTLSNGPTGQSTAWTSGDAILTISHTGLFTAGTHTFTMTTADDPTGNSLAGAISGVTHPATFTVASSSSSTTNIDYVSNNSIELNDGADCTTDNTLNVVLKASDAVDYLLSTDSSFLTDAWASFEPQSTDGTGSNGKTIRVMTLTYPLDSLSGAYTLYAKFRSRSGNVSNLATDSITLDLENNCEGSSDTGDAGDGTSDTGDTTDDTTDTGDTTDDSTGDTGDTTDGSTDTGDTTDDTSDQGDAGSGEKPTFPDTGISPVTNQPEVVNTDAIEPDRFMQGFNFSEVYWIGDDYKRHTIFNAFTFYTYETTRSVIKLVTDATLAQLEFGQALGPKPGSVLIKFQSAPEVYYIQENPADQYKPYLRHIPTEELAVQQIGDNWKDYVLELEPTFFERFLMGNPVTAEDTLDLTNLVEVFELEQAASFEELYEMQKMQ